MEKDCTRQELRTLLADPAIGFAALSGDGFFAALKQACQDGTANPALIADCERKITSREAGPRELHQMLLAASDRHACAGVPRAGPGGGRPVGFRPHRALNLRPPDTAERPPAAVTDLTTAMIRRRRVLAG